MTLILVLANQEQCVQVSDRRVSVNGRLQDDEHNKAGVLFTADAKLAYGFTGLATYDGFQTRTWLNSALYECAPPDFRAHSTLQRLAQRASHDFRSLPVLQQLLQAPIDERHKRLAIVFSGYLYGYSLPRVVFASVANFPPAGNARSSYNIADFQFQGKIQRPGKEISGIVRSIGTRTPVAADDIELLRKLLADCKPTEALVGKAIDTIQSAADSSRSKGRIGKQLSSIIVRCDPEKVVETKYYSDVVGYTSYLPDVVFARSESEHRAYVCASLKAVDPDETSPLVWPKVGRNEPCPCGSGKKYKRCHGRPGR